MSGHMGYNTGLSTLAGKFLGTLLGSLLMASPSFSGDLLVDGAYFRTAGPLAKSGGAFMQLFNLAVTDDRLMAVSSNIAVRVEMHQNIDAGNSVMQMRKVEGGFLIPAGGVHILERGGDHLMFMGLTRRIVDGDVITVVLSFQNAGDISIDIPVDLGR
ncbi:MAG: copper chaperone PCu(A)C [Paracoccaceae bacterium]